MPFTPNNSRLYLIPFSLSTPVQWDRLAIDVGIAEAGKVFRLGIYLGHPTEGLPADKLIQTSELSLTSTGIVEDTIELALLAGLYWAAYTGDSTTAELTTHGVEGLLGSTTPGGTRSKFVSISNTYTPGEDLPATVSSFTYETEEVPIVALRAF